MKRILAPLLPWLLLAPLGAAEPSASPAPPPNPSGERYLFIVGTSSSMERLDQGGRQALFELLFTGLDGHMRPGDTYGVWTFNDELNAGGFPMQVWHTNDLLQLTSAATLHVKEQKYRDRLHTDVALGPALNLVKSIGEVTLIFITDDTMRVKGTPFDDVINGIYKKRGDEVRNTQQPFVSMFVGRHGQLANVSVVLAGERLNLPPRKLPDPPPQPAPQATASSTTPKSAKSATAPAPHAGDTSPPGARSIVIKRETLADGTKSDVQVKVDGKPAPVATSQDDLHVTTPMATPAPAPIQPSATPALETVSGTSESDSSLPRPPASTPAPAPLETAPASSPAPAPSTPMPRLHPFRSGPITVAAREREPAPEPQPALTGVVTPPSRGAGQSFLWLAAGVTFVVAALTFAILFGLLLRRSHQHSAITQSMYRR